MSLLQRHKFEVERVDIALKKSFAATVAAFEQKAPAANLSVFVQLAASRATPAQIEQAVHAMAGDLGFMTLAKIDPGPLVSLLGKSKKMTIYLMGNPVFANRMYEQHPAVALYAPLRIAIYEDLRGTTHFTYERPSRSLAQFQNREIEAVGRMLDEKMDNLTASLED
jgi:uncharacterized protein (DUF302 family)